MIGCRGHLLSDADEVCKAGRQPLARAEGGYVNDDAFLTVLSLLLRHLFLLETS